MPVDHADPAHIHLAERTRLRPGAAVFAGGVILGLLVGLLLGWALASGLAAPSKWRDASGGWVRLPEQTALAGSLPQTVLLPASSYDFGGIAQPLSPTAVDAASIVKLEVRAETGRVGVSLARPDGGELVSREAVLGPQQGKTTLYFRATPGLGPVNVLLRSADATPAGASATISTLQIAKEADLGQGETRRMAKAGVY